MPGTQGRRSSPRCNPENCGKLLGRGIKERTLVARALWAGQDLVFKCLFSSVSPYGFSSSSLKNSLVPVYYLGF